MSGAERRSQVVLDAEHLERVLGLLMEQADRRDADMPTVIANAVTMGIAEGFKAALKDEEAVERFWKVGYKHLSAQAHDDVSRSVGRRVIGWLAAALLAAGITLAAMNAKGGS